MGYSPWRHQESDRSEATEHACTHLEKYSSAVYGIQGLAPSEQQEIKTRHRWTLYDPVRQGTEEHSHLQRMHMADAAHQTRELTYVTGYANTRSHL